MIGKLDSLSSRELHSKPIEEAQIEPVSSSKYRTASKQDIIQRTPANQVLAPYFRLSERRHRKNDIGFAIISPLSVEGVAVREVDEPRLKKLGKVQDARGTRSMQALRLPRIDLGRLGAIVSSGVNDHVRPDRIDDPFHPIAIRDRHRDLRHSSDPHRIRVIGDEDFVAIPQTQREMRSDETASSYDQNRLRGNHSLQCNISFGSEAFPQEGRPQPMEMFPS